MYVSSSSSQVSAIPETDDEIGTVSFNLQLPSSKGVRNASRISTHLGGVELTINTSHRMVILADPGHKHVEDRRAACGVYHIAFTLDTLADLADSYEQKKALGILPHWPVNHGMSTSMYYFDPDRNEFELQVDNFATVEETHAFMRTEEFRGNPIGVDFVPEKFVGRVRSGEDEAEIKKRPVIGERHTRWENSIYFKPEGKWDNK